MTSLFRVLPSFLILGAQRCGTSSLFRMIARHPQAALAMRKEVHFFDLYFDRGESWYRMHFPLRWLLPKRAAVGEATPYYLFHPQAPARVRAVVPDAKLIVLLRDPVSRALSAYHHQVRRARESLRFEEAIEREAERLAGEDDRLANDGRHRSPNHQHFSYLARGFYARQLERWLAHFPREQLLVLRSEDFFRDPAGQANQVCRFLGIAQGVAVDPPRANAGGYPPMASDLDARLRAHFAEPNERLRVLLGWDRSW